MLFDQPCDKSGLAFGQAVRNAELARIYCTEFRMIAAATLGDVVEQSGDQQQLGLAQARPYFVGNGETLV
ncbi:MAG: hypothetical protein ABIP61_15630, partial [Burkholderiaceae bacterium]